MRTQEQLHALIAKSATWMRVGDGNYQVAGTGIARDTTVSHAELQLFDNRLPSYMQHLCSMMETLKLPLVVPGGALRDTLRNWYKPYLVIEDTSGAQHTVRQVLSIKLDEQFECVTFYYDEASIVNFRHASADGTGHARGIAGMFQHMVEVSCEWMDGAFPGWRTRMAVIESLGLSDEEAAAFILSDNTPLQNLPLPDVEFD